MINKNLKLIVFILIIAACSSPQVINDLSPTPRPIIIPTQTQTATVTATSTPRLIRTQTPILKPTLRPTYEATPITPIPTAISFDENDQFIADLETQNYKLIFGSSTIGPGGYIYSAYLFTDMDLEAMYGEDATPEICRLAIYLWNGEQNLLIRTFGAPMFPEGNRYHGYPVWCEHPGLRDVSSTSSMEFDPDEETIYWYSLKSGWSDINQNGLPEFKVFYWYCPNACDGHQATVHYYEIQNTSTIVDITADLPGIKYGGSFDHEIDPLEFYVFDATHEYIAHLYIYSYWIYGWNGEEYVDHTPSYAEEFLVWGSEKVAEIETYFGTELFYAYQADMLEIVFQYEKADMRWQAVETFLELSDPANWSLVENSSLCWLQLSRAMIQDDYENGRPFREPPDTTYLSYDFYINLYEELSTANYDVSSCFAISE
ncbi:MAG: hypothetical protein FVQ83_13360 [Chloroflexi bacterium]|nr:hypothetical protein [Chloroflexota bacterium]